MNSKLLITGSSGTIGSRLASLLQHDFSLDTPTKNDLDLCQFDNLTRYLHSSQPDVIIHCAAVTNSPYIETERNNKQASTWNINVEVTKHLSLLAQQMNAFFIFVSTGSVFSGNNSHQSFEETDPPSEDDQLSWYAITKKYAEKTVTTGAILRLSHPLGGVFAPSFKPDYLTKMLHLYQQKHLYPLFDDVFFPITYIPDLVFAIKQIIHNKYCGIFHPVTVDLCSPFQLMHELISKKNMTVSLQSIHFDQFMIDKPPASFAQYYQLNGEKTRNILHLPPRSWKQIIPDYV